MHFKHVTTEDVPLLKKWFKQGYIAEYWYGKGLQNTYDSIDKFTNGEACIFTLWIAYDETTPFGFLMTSYATKEDAFYVKHLPEGTKAITLDLLIGNTDYLGKGLSHVMIQQLLLQKYSDIDFVFIDPGITNEKAIHVYKKAGFTPIDEFDPPWNPGCNCLLMRLSMNELRYSSHAKY